MPPLLCSVEQHQSASFTRPASICMQHILGDEEKSRGGVWKKSLQGWDCDVT